MNPAVTKVHKILSNIQALPKIHLSNLPVVKPKSVKIRSGRIEPQALTGEKTLPKKIARNFKKGPKFFSGSSL